MEIQPTTIKYIPGSHDSGHELDLYLPSPSSAPSKVLVFIHGGAWISDDKNDYAQIGKYFSARGLAVAVVNYRLSGKHSPIKHPAHAEDIAQALHWLVKNAEKYHCFSDRFYVMGFSAGANLAGLMFLDPRFKAPLNAIKGWIGIEGIYDIPSLVKTFPTYQAWFIDLAFGTQQQSWKQASPQLLSITQKTPWLLVHSPEDELVDMPQTLKFAEHLKAGGVSTNLITEIRNTHYGVIRAVGSEGDPTTAAILKFIHQNQ